jgi:hypothetical protein
VLVVSVLTEVVGQPAALLICVASYALAITMVAVSLQRKEAPAPVTKVAVT